MKSKLVFVFALLLTAAQSFAQNSAYLKTMEGLVSKIQTTQFGTPLQPLANQMERIASAEKGEWLPNYWVAFCYLRDSYIETDAAKKDMILDKADEYFNKAEALSQNNDELEVLKANLANGRLVVSPQDRWQTYGAKVAAAIGNAKKINAENPRISLLEGEGMFYTPEAFGGGKPKAKVFFEKALEKYAKFTPKSSIHPSWGKEITDWYISQCN